VGAEVVGGLGHGLVDVQLVVVLQRKITEERVEKRGLTFCRFSMSAGRLVVGWVGLHHDGTCHQQPDPETIDDAATITTCLRSVGRAMGSPKYEHFDDAQSLPRTRLKG
jgi:hypothetical protein